MHFSKAMRGCALLLEVSFLVIFNLTVAYVACGKKLTKDGTSTALPVEDTLNHNYSRYNSVCYATL
jgi:hypothetical protein